MVEKDQSRMARRQQNQNQKQKNTKKKPVIKRIMKIMLLAILLIGIGVAGLFAFYISTAPDLDPDKLSVPASTKLYDINKDIFADLGAEKRSKVSYDEIPEVLKNAILATEDVRFESHIGIDFRRIGAAVVANFTDGFGSQGASTITQQVVKSSFLSSDKKLKRKVQEQWLALQLERKYSKEEIFEMYVNKIYYGAGAYGVATAAETYFGKTDLNDLTLAEAAILAGIPQRPSAYDPFVNPDLTKERMNTVLNLMVQHNKISEQEADEVRDVDVASLLVETKKQYAKYEGFIQQVRNEVLEKTGADIYKDSLQVYTTLDPVAQEETELLLSNADENPIDYSSDQDIQVGITVLDTKTGAIRAIGGGRNREKGGWNYAIDGDGRQGGSSMKPLLAYGPAIEYLKWSTYHQINDDKAYKIEGTDSSINNWDTKFHGWVSARYALEQSYNVPAVKTLEEVGYSKAQSFAEGLGLNFDSGSITITDAIGGADNGFLPIEMAGAYAAFGNEGIYHEPYSVTEIEYPDGKTEELVSKPVEAMSDYTAYMITDMLKSAVDNGTGRLAKVNGLPVAGKTGTTNISGEEGSPDSWFTGYTTNYTISIWSGYSGGDEQKPINNTKIPLHIFRELMQTISSGKDTADFEKPSSVVEMKVEKGSNPAKRPSEFTPSSQIITELFVKGNEPSAVSEKFDKLDPVSKLKAAYNEETESIDVEWAYKDKDATFDVNISSDGNAINNTSTDDTTFAINNVEKGATYTIEVVAKRDDLQSDPTSVTVKVPEEEVKEIPAVSQLQQSFDPVNRTASISWAYDEKGPIEFQIDITEAGSSVDQLTTNKKTVTLNQLQVDKIYTITVTPILKNDSEVSGPSASVQVSTKGLTEEEDEQESDNTNEDDSDVEGDTDTPDDETNTDDNQQSGNNNGSQNDTSNENATTEQQSVPEDEDN